MDNKNQTTREKTNFHSREKSSFILHKTLHKFLDSWILKRHKSIIRINEFSRVLGDSIVTALSIAKNAENNITNLFPVLK